MRHRYSGTIVPPKRVLRVVDVSWIYPYSVSREKNLGVSNSFYKVENGDFKPDTYLSYVGERSVEREGRDQV